MASKLPVHCILRVTVIAKGQSDDPVFTGDHAVNVQESARLAERPMSTYYHAKHQQLSRYLLADAGTDIPPSSSGRYPLNSRQGVAAIWITWNKERRRYKCPLMAFPVSTMRSSELKRPPLTATISSSTKKPYQTCTVFNNAASREIKHSRLPAAH